MLVGFEQWGKTMFLAAMWDYFSYETPDGIIFTAEDDGRRRELDEMCNLLHRNDIPSSTTSAEEWRFIVNAPGLSGKRTGAFKLIYVDYPGNQLDRYFGTDGSEAPQEPLDSRLQEALEHYDVIVGLLDGSMILEIMNDNLDPRYSTDLRKLFRLISMHGDKTVHLVVTKWDRLYDRYKPADIAERLRELSPLFDRFCESQSAKRTTKRLIPVAALGTNGFATTARDGSVTISPGKPWMSDSAERPIVCALPDALTGELRRLHGAAPGFRESEATGNVSWAAFRLLAPIIEIFTLEVPVPPFWPGIKLTASVTGALIYLSKMVSWRGNRILRRPTFRSGSIRKTDQAKALETVITSWSKRTRAISKDREACYILKPRKARRRR